MKILTSRQQLFLKLFGKNTLARQFYLTGGTALAGFYLKHRYSEDLDFFSEQEVDPMAIQIFLKGVQGSLGFAKIDFQQSFNRNLFFLHFPDGEILKTEFTYFPFPRIESGEKHEGVQLDSLLDIAVNKLFTIYQRTKARDYIDLYALCTEKGLTVSDLSKKVRVKFDTHVDPLQLGTQFLKSEKAQDFPRLLEAAQRVSSKK